ncbi:MAG TPA: hypothetical protein VGR95_14250 [Thermoanaerobaculia bacterium]|jgi:hypothetical protein|nr:hypothetical protein [Thermoanaerobaculia bacterium]
MRRVFVALTLVGLVACRRETPGKPVKPASGIRHPASVSTQTAAPAPKVTGKSRPERCAGDGSYDAAVECIRIAAALHFKSSDGAGDMIRSTPGAERLVVDTGDGHWVAEAQRTGIIWTRDGKAVKDVPRKLEKLWERLTIFPDPQKKEGKPVLSMEGNTRRYDFTDANTGDRYSVWVAPGDGHITKLRVNDWMIEFA